jgi:hypothetical protein
MVIAPNIPVVAVVALPELVVPLPIDALLGEVPVIV